MLKNTEGAIKQMDNPDKLDNRVHTMKKIKQKHRPSLCANKHK
jgi:hypothetical protein